jgi:hypothetical protein
LERPVCALPERSDVRIVPEVRQLVRIHRGRVCGFVNRDLDRRLEDEQLRPVPVHTRGVIGGEEAGDVAPLNRRNNNVSLKRKRPAETRASDGRNDLSVPIYAHGVSGGERLVKYCSSSAQKGKRVTPNLFEVEAVNRTAGAKSF